MSYFSQKQPLLYIALVITSHPLLNGFVNLEIYFFLFLFHLYVFLLNILIIFFFFVFLLILVKYISNYNIEYFCTGKSFVHFWEAEIVNSIRNTSKSNNRIFQITYPTSIMCFFIHLYIYGVVWFGSFDFHHVSAYFFCFIHISSFCSLCMNNILTSISQKGIGGVIVWWAKRKYFLRDFLYSFSFQIYILFSFVHYI